MDIAIDLELEVLDAGTARGALGRGELAAKTMNGLADPGGVGGTETPSTSMESS